jgi:hypothetical protein
MNTPRPKCEATNRGGTKCQRPAGWGTENLTGRCKLHGGATPIKHGRYSQIKRTRVKELYEEFRQDPEVALLRAIMVDLQERWDEIYGEDGALLAWHESFKTNRFADGKPTMLPDFSSVSQIIDRVGAMVDRIVKHKKEASISMATLTRVMEQLGVDVARAISKAGLNPDVESKLLQSIETSWNSVSLESK